MDRAELAARNRAIASFHHRVTLRQHIRRWLLTLISRLPVAPPPAPARPDSILLIRPDHVGDVLFTVPAIRALSRALPGAEITALVGPWSAGVLAPFLTPPPGEAGRLARILTLPFPGFARGRQFQRTAISPYVLAWQSAQRLRKLGAAAAVVMRPDHWWGALAAYLAGIPVRVGYDLPDVRPFLTEQRPFAAQTHSVRRNLDLVARWTGHIPDDEAPLAFPVLDEDRAYIESYLAAQGCCDASAPLVVIHPGAGSAYKTWLPARWAAVADALSERMGARIVLTGMAREAYTVRAIARAMTAPQKPIIAVDDTTLGQLAALCARADLVLGPDSGPLHLAVSVGTPTVHLYGPADPIIYGPWGESARHSVLQSTLACVACGVLDWSGDDLAYHPCIHEIGVAQVLAAAGSVLM
ncbi:MAG: glycosyltransferase family 9 protein [Anaerolineae bacterium]|nr:glycosyltransferase family 9 protein [Anaerolineae bacterium]